MDHRIVPAAEGDWPEIWPLWHAVVSRGDTYTFAPDTPSDAARRTWLPGAPAETWTVRNDERIVGTYLLKPNQAGPGAHVANAGFMVAPEERGRGVGRSLAEHCLARARALGYRGMQFNAVVETNTRAVALWTALGFAIVGTVPEAFRHPTEGYVGLHVMYRSLD